MNRLDGGGGQRRTGGFRCLTGGWWTDMVGFMLRARRADRLLGEHGTGQDSAAGRQEFERQMERRPMEAKYVLTRLEPTKPQPSRVRFEKRNGYTVGISDQPVSEQAIRDALDEFPCVRAWRLSTGSGSALSTGELSTPRRS